MHDTFVVSTSTGAFMMRKLWIVPAVLAMASVSGSAFAQRVSSTSGNTGNGSAAISVGNPIVQTNIAVAPQISVLNSGGSGNQTGNSLQGNLGSIGINGGITSGQGVR
jgi:hypothetical protein